MATFINSVDAPALEARWPAVFSQDGGLRALWGVRVSEKGADAQALSAQRPPAIWLDAAAFSALEAPLNGGYFVAAADDAALLLLHSSFYPQAAPEAAQARLAAQGQGLYSLVQDATALVEQLEEEIAVLQARGGALGRALDAQRGQSETLRQEADALRGALDAQRGQAEALQAEADGLRGALAQEQAAHMDTRHERDALAKTLAAYRRVLARRVMRVAARALPAEDRAILGPEEGES